MLRFLLWVLLLYWLLVIVRRVVSWMLGITRPQDGMGAKPREASRRLHRDPVCGVHVAEEISFPLREGGTTLYFCSEECRRKYAASGTGNVSKEA
jgi:YHS domain-containing protein